MRFADKFVMEHQTDNHLQDDQRPDTDRDPEVRPPARKTAGPSSARATFEVVDMDSARIMRAAAAVMLGFQVIYLELNWPLAASSYISILPLHLMNIAAIAAFVLVVNTDWGERNLRPLVIGVCAIYFLGTGLVSLRVGNCEVLVATLVIAMMSAAALIPWDVRWQTALAIIGTAVMLIWTLSNVGADPWLGYHWLTFATAVAFAHFITRMSLHRRQQLTDHICALEDSRRRLIDEAAEREQAAAAIDRANRQLRDSEAKLRKIFEASPDAIAINRMSDGRHLDVNASFLASGYTREETLTATAATYEAWADRSEYRRFLDQIKSTGAVDNMEISVRYKDGTLRPFLVSARMVEVDGEACVVTICRDIKQLKETERALVAAREELRSRLEALELSEGRLRAEIAQGERLIAEREQALARLAESEAKLRKVFEASPDTITINRLSDGRYLDINEGFAISGYTREETLAASGATLPTWSSRDELRHFHRQIKSTGAVDNMEISVRYKDGTVWPFLVSARLVELGGESCMITISRNIEKIKQTERELVAAREELSAQLEARRLYQQRLDAEVAERERLVAERERLIAEREQALARLAESEGKLRRVFDASLDIIAITNLEDGRTIEVNQSFLDMCGYALAEVIGRTVSELGVWADREQRSQFAATLKRQGFVRDAEVMLRHRSGRTMPYLVSAVVAKIGGERCVIAIARDNFERKRAERQLIQAREAALAASLAKSEFLSSMSHEIRTPMNAILGMADLLWESPLSADERRYVEMMRNNGNALLDLINSILDLAKVESGRLNLEQTPLAPAETVEKVLETVAIRAHEKGLELIGRIAPDLPATIIGDPLRLRQILINLVGNAIKFTERGEIEVVVEVLAAGAAGSNAPSALRFSVRDSGIGIAPDKLDAIFSSFTQADSSIARRYGGSGLGLTIVRRLIALMEGELTVASQPGAGSTFSFTLPLTPAATAPLAPSRRLDRIRALVVDDNAANRDTVAAMLAGAGAQTTQAAGGAEAIAVAESARAAGAPFELIVIDERMPDLDGIETAHRLKSAPGTVEDQYAIILMLTTDALATTRVRLDDCGLNPANRCDNIVKPARRAELIGAAASLTGVADRGHHTFGATAYSTTPAAANGTAPTAGAAAPAKPLRILLADDSTDNRVLIEAYLKNLPYTLDHAGDGAVAIELVKQRPYDLVLMDIQMPVVDGYSAVRTIRAWERARGAGRVPIIALTASALEEAVRTSIEVGCDAHVSKPVKKATLVEAIRRATDMPARRNREKENVAAAANGGGYMKRNVVRVDADLSDLIPGFLDHKRTDTRTILDAIECGDFDTLARISHKIKGEGGSYGLDMVSEIGAAIEQAGRTHDLAAARRAAEELVAYLDSLEIEYA